MHLEQKEKIGNHKPMPVRDDHLHMFRSQGRLSCAIGGRAFYAWAIFVEKLRYHSYRAGIHLLAGTQQLGLQGYQYWIRDPYNSCWLATNLSRSYIYIYIVYIYIIYIYKQYIYIYIYIILYIHISMVHQWIIIPKMLQTPRLRLYGWSCFLGSVYTFCFWSTRAWENGLKCHNQ